MKHIALILSLMVTGCSTTLLQTGAAINDVAVDNAVFTLCYAGSVGAIKREFAGRGKTYNDLCSPPEEEPGNEIVK